MLSKSDLTLLLDTLEEAHATDTGHHWLPVKYSSDLLKCITLIEKELRNLNGKQTAKQS